MSESILLGIIILLLIVFIGIYIVQNRKIKRLTERYENFMKGKDAKDLSSAIEENFVQMQELEEKQKKTEERVDDGLRTIATTFHKMGIVKYDAFKEMGGNLSFALCLLDDNNTGFILNTMHGRDSSYSYIKEVIKGEAYASLGEEEKEALEKALDK